MHEARRDACRIQCSQCGEYVITGTLLAINLNLSQDEKVFLSGYVRNSSENKNLLELSSENLKDLIKLACENKKLKLSDKSKNILNFIVSKTNSTVGGQVQFNLFNDFPLFYCRSLDEFRSLLLSLSDSQKVGIILGSPRNFTLSLTFKGLENYEGMNSDDGKSEPAVVMFDSDEYNPSVDQKSNLKYPKSHAYINEFVRSMNEKSIVELVSQSSCVLHYVISIDMENIRIQLDEAVVDDFEIALEKYTGTNYYYSVESQIKFKIIGALGIEGLIPNFSVSSELLQEKGDWLKDYRVDTKFSDNFCGILFAGLKKMSLFYDELISAYQSLSVPIKADKEYIDSLINYYESKKSFSSQQVSMESLSFLKTAAVCEIIDFERQKEKIKVSRLIRELDKKIYSIVLELRKPPFIGIRLPKCIQDYVQFLNKDHLANKETKNIEANASTDKELDTLLSCLDPVFAKKYKGAWLAFNSDNPDRLSQASNSMVELLDKVIGKVCGSRELKDVLKEKYETHEELTWIEATRKWISETKSQLHRVKHHTDYKAEIIAKQLMQNTENILRILLEC